MQGHCPPSLLALFSGGSKRSLQLQGIPNVLYASLTGSLPFG